MAHRKGYQKEYLQRPEAKTARKLVNKNNKLKSRYGITQEDYNKMFDDQQGCCKACGKHQSELKRTLDVDHCHETNKVRGLLCNRCNLILGLCNDDILKRYNQLFITWMKR